MAEASKYRIESVSRATDVLGAFLRPPHRFGLAELTAGTGLTKNQTFRMLQTLLLSGFVVQDGDTKTYRLGARLVELASVAVHGSDLVRVAAPVLDALTRRTGETVNLITLHDDRTAICVDKRDSPQALRITARVGARFPLHAGASPKVLLATSSPDAIADYVQRCQPFRRFTPNTITDPAALLTELDRIRDQGYAVSHEEMDHGICSIAAPVRDRDGAVVAGLSVAAPTIRTDPAERRHRIAAVREAAAEITIRLTGATAPAAAPDLSSNI